MTIILDTSVIMSFLLNIKKGSTYEVVKLAKERKFIFATSPDTLDELKSKISHPKFQTVFKENQAKVSQFVAWYKYNSKIFEITEKVQICRDPHDDKFLDLAIASEAKFLLTGDLDLLELEFCGQTKILKPKDFLKQL